jgi:hypothetical protein
MRRSEIRGSSCWSWRRSCSAVMVRIAIAKVCYGPFHALVYETMPHFQAVVPCEHVLSTIGERGSAAISGLKDSNETSFELEEARQPGPVTALDQYVCIHVRDLWRDPGTRHRT